MLFLIHILPEEKTCYVCTTTSKARASLGNYNFPLSSPLRVGLVEIIVKSLSHLVHAVESIFSDYIQTNAYPWE